MTNGVNTLGLQRRRTISPGGWLISERPHPPKSYLIESGLVAVSVALDSTPPTYVDLLAAGTLIEVPTNSGPYASSYQAVSSVSLLEISPGLLQEAMQLPALQRAYVQQLLRRLVQTELAVACNAHHSLARRCARWLLRLQAQLGPVLPVTHAFLATVLGVRRAGISTALESLQRSDLIRQRRGSIEVVDPAALAANACPCPNNVTCPENAISADLIGGDVIGTESLRAWSGRRLTSRLPWLCPETNEAERRNILAKALTALAPGQREEFQQDPDTRSTKQLISI